MKQYSVVLSISGDIDLTVKADSVKQAIALAIESEGLDKFDRHLNISGKAWEDNDE